MGGVMKRIHLSLILALIIALWGLSSSLGAQINYLLELDSASSTHLQARLHMTNVGTEAYYHEFPGDPFCGLALDGEVLPWNYNGVLTPITIYPEIPVYFDIFYGGSFANGIHSIQAVLLTNEGYEFVGEEIPINIGHQQLTIGAGNSTARVPIDFYWRTSLYECIFLQHELAGMTGRITNISFYNNFSTLSMPMQEIQIFLGYTSQANLAQGWITAFDLNLVFDGFADFIIGQNETNITLDTPFLLPPNRNLVMMVHRILPSSYGVTSDPFIAQACQEYNARRHSSDSTTLSPYYPPAATAYQLIAMTPKTTFWYYPEVVSSPEDTIPGIALPTLTNYPNPFNPQTTIGFELPTSGPASLSVYNARGQKVTELLSENLSAGSYTKTWDASAQASGIYYLRLEHNGTRTGKSILLIK